MVQQFETAQFMPAAVRAKLSGELVCYARTVVHQEWPEMEAGTLGNSFNPWGVAMFRTMQKVEPKSNAEQDGVRQMVRPEIAIARTRASTVSTGPRA